MMINTILSVYGRRAKENGITVNISARVSNKLLISPQDLVVIIANLLENAINGTTNLEQNNKHIDIFIKESAQRLLIKVENPCKENFDFNETQYGVGIRSVIFTTDKYEGMHDFTAKNGIFSAKISLNLM
jgi:LytS/YehU family sensor histidine kinase